MYIVSVVAFVGLGSQSASSQPSSFLLAQRAAPAPTAASNLCGKLPWACAQDRLGAKVQSGHLPQISAINRQINRQVRSVEDQRQYRMADYWSLPTTRGGDCEDFALLKKQALIQRGFPAQSLLIATALDKNRRGHAVLIVRTNRGDYVLDNLTNKVLRWSDTGYIFLRMQNPDSPRNWVTLARAS